MALLRMGARRRGIAAPISLHARVHANGWSFRCLKPEDYARQAERVVSDGYTALNLGRS